MSALRVNSGTGNGKSPRWTFHFRVGSGRRTGSSGRFGNGGLEGRGFLDGSCSRPDMRLLSERHLIPADSQFLQGKSRRIEWFCRCDQAAPRARPVRNGRPFAALNGLVAAADHRLQNRADEVVRVLRTRAGPDHVGDENPSSRSDRRQPGALKQAVGFAVLGPASRAEPSGFRKTPRRATEPPTSLRWRPAVAGLDSGGSL